MSFARLLLSLALLSASTADRPVGADAGGNADADAVWRSWIAAERASMNWSTRVVAELDAYEKNCAAHAPSLVATARAHDSLSRVLVFDARYNWNGLGDSTERYAYLLRAGRALGRAVFVLFDSCSLLAPPPRPNGSVFWRRAGPATTSAFDPTVWVTQLGGRSWRWSQAEADAYAAKHGGRPPEPLRLHFSCGNDDMHDCKTASVVRQEGGAVEVAVADATSSEAAMVVIWRHLNETLRDHPFLWLSTRIQGDLAWAARLPWVEAAAGHARMSCEAFAFWRPRPHTWAAMRAPLEALGAWRGGAVALLARTGMADHLDSAPFAFAPSTDAGATSSAALSANVAALFTPCDARLRPGDAPLRRHWRAARPGMPPCVTYDDDGGRSATPTVSAAAGCGPDPGGGASALAAPFEGPLGVFVACAARAAAALAADAAAAEAAAGGEAAGGGGGDAWGVFLFSDAPALLCAFEAVASSSTAAAGRHHGAVTQLFPGHLQYAPDNDLLRVGLSVVVDSYILQLVDLVLPITHTAFLNAAGGRRMLPPKAPAGWDAARPSAGFERWFVNGRENAWTGLMSDVAGRRVNRTLVQLLATTSDACPTTRVGMLAAHGGGRAQPEWAEPTTERET